MYEGREGLRAMNAEAARARTQKEARRLEIMKRVVEVLGWLTAVARLAFASHAIFAAAPAGRDTGESKSRGRTRTARERREDLSPASIMRDARPIYVAPSEH